MAALFRRRNFNIESLAVGRTEDPEVSRMTVVVDCPNGDMDAHKIEANLYKLVNVIDVQDVTRQPSVTRDLALIKVKVGPEKRAEVNGLADIFRARIVATVPCRRLCLTTTAASSHAAVARASSIRTRTQYLCRATTLASVTSLSRTKVACMPRTCRATRHAWRRPGHSRRAATGDTLSEG